MISVRKYKNKIQKIYKSEGVDNALNQYQEFLKEDPSEHDLKELKTFISDICTEEIKKIYKTKNVETAIEKCQLLLTKIPNNAELHTLLGDLYMEWHLDVRGSRKYADEAITEYQRALEEHIDSPKLFFKIGTAHYHKNDLDKALNYFHSAIEKDETYADAYYMSSQTQAKKGNFQQAIDDIELAIKYYGIHSSKAHYLYHNLLKFTSFMNFSRKIMIMKEFIKSVILLPFDAEALKNLKRALSYFKYAPSIMYAFHEANNNKNRIEGVNKAVEIFNDAINEAPGFLPFYNALGEIYYTVGQYEDAICEFKTAIWIDSLNISAYRGLCRCYEEMEDYESAAETYETLIKIHPYNAEYHSNLASILFLQGDIDKVIEHYHQAISLSPSKPWTSIVAQTLGYVHQAITNDLDAAISAYQCAYVLTPRDMEIYINLGKAFYDKNDLDNSLTIYKKALELAPHSSEIHCNIGYLYWDKGELEEAIKEYELSIKYDASYSIPYNNIGVIYLDDYARVQKSIEYFESAIECNPNYVLAHYNLARALIFKGEKIEAAKHFQEALDINNVTQEMDSQDISDKLKGLFE